MLNDPKRMGMLAAGGALLQSAGRSPRPINTAEAIGRGLQAYMGGSQQGMFNQSRMAQGQMQQVRMMQQQQANDWMVKNAPKLQSGNVKMIGQEMMSTGNPILMQQGMEMLKMAPKAKSFGKVMGPDGIPVHQAFMEDGSFGAVGGNPVADKLMAQNTGRETQLLNPYTGQPVNKLQNTMSPGEGARLAQSQQQFGQSHGLAQQRMALDIEKMKMTNDPTVLQQRAFAQSAGTTLGKDRASAMGKLPQAEANASESIRLIDELLEHPGFKTAVGKSSAFGLANMLPGTDVRAFNIRLDQIKGKQFLEAFQSLKGGGHITEIEGEKATQAMARMDTASTEEEFKTASREFQDIMRDGLDRMRQQAGVIQPQQPQQLQQPANDGWSVQRIE